MDEQPISPDVSVAEILRGASSVQRVFIRNRTACVGCSLARFCSLRDVAATYGLVLDDLIRELDLTVHAQTQLSQRSEP